MSILDETLREIERRRKELENEQQSTSPSLVSAVLQDATKRIEQEAATLERYQRLTQKADPTTPARSPMDIPVLGSLLQSLSPVRVVDEHKPSPLDNLPAVKGFLQAISPQRTYTQEELDNLRNRFEDFLLKHPTATAVLDRTHQALTQNPLTEILASAARHRWPGMAEDSMERMGISIPPEDSFTGVIGKVGGTLADFAIAGGAARGAIGAASSRFPRMADTLARYPWFQGLLRGAATGVGATEMRRMRGEEIEPQDYLRTVAFMSGSGAAAPYAAGLATRMLPANLTPALHGPVRSSIESLAGSAAAIPFSSAETPGEFVAEIGIELAADAILGALMYGLNPAERAEALRVRRNLDQAMASQRQARADAMKRFGLDDTAIRNAEEARESVKRAYRQQARQLHPDVGGSPEEFQQLKSAYDEALRILESQEALPKGLFSRAKQWLDSVMGMGSTAQPETVPRTQADATPQPHPGGVQPDGPPGTLLPAPQAVAETPPTPRIQPTPAQTPAEAQLAPAPEVIHAPAPTPDAVQTPAPTLDVIPEPATASDREAVQPTPTEPEVTPTEAVTPTEITEGTTVYHPNGEALTVIDASDQSKLRVRNARGTEFEIGRQAVHTSPPAGPESPETARGDLAPTALAPEAVEPVRAPEGTPAPEGPQQGASHFPPLTDNYRKPLSTYTPSIYRETSVDRAVYLIPGTGSTSDLARDELYFASNPDLALGQGDNKGVLLEFASDNIEGQVDLRKPMARALYDQGQAEFIVRHTGQKDFQDSLRRITIKGDTEIPKVHRVRLGNALKQLETQGWTKTDHPDGSTSWSHPEAQQHEQSIATESEVQPAATDPVHAPATKSQSSRVPEATPSAEPTDANIPRGITESPAPEFTTELGPLPTRSTGRTSTSRTERGTEVETQYAIVDAVDLVPSHDTALRVNPAFPQELQPRDRTRVASEDQINRMANNLQPEFLGDIPKASEGAPIVGPDGVVESGNARTIAITKAYREGKADHYRQFLIENAEQFGIDPASIEGVSNPVLVRVRQSDVDRVRFASEANESSVATMSATEQAVSDADRVSEGLMNLFMPSEDGEILTSANRDFISRFMQDVVGPSERGRYMTEDGRISQEGVVRIRNAVFQKAYNDADALAVIAESTDNNIRNITGGMLIAAPRFADMRQGIQEGRLHDLDPSTEITDAMAKLSDLRSTGTSVDMYLSQTTLFDDDLSDLAKDFLQTFDKYKRSQKRIGNILRTYTELVEMLGDPRQESLFPQEVMPTKAELLETAIAKVEDGYDPRTSQASLFESEPSSGTVVEKPTQQVDTGAGTRTSTGETRGFPATATEPVTDTSTESTTAHVRVPPIREDRPAVTRKDVIDYIEHEFMMPVREGRLRNPRARGEFNLRTHVTRLRRAEDFRALTHELGHFLSETMNLQTQLYDELEPLGAALYPDADTELKREEGAAEFFYLYFSRPDEARAAAPTFYSDFEQIVDQEPGLAAKVRQAQKMFMAQFEQTGTAAIKAAIVRSDAKDLPFLTTVQKVYTNWIDDLHPIYQAMKVILGEQDITSEWDVDVSQNPYILGRLARGRYAKADTFLRRAQISPDFQHVGPSLQEILRPVAANIEDFEAYLVARRAVELHERGINPGVRRSDAEAAVRELDNDDFRRAQRELVAYQDNLIEHLIDAGVLSAEAADSFREMNKNYVPFYRYFGEETMSGGMVGSRLKWGNLPQPVRAIRGSSRSIMSPLQSIMRNTITLIDIAERNRAARALADLADEAEGVGWLIERVPTPMQPNKVELERLRKDLLAAGISEEALAEADLSEVAVVFSPVRHARIKESKENILTIYRDGTPHFYQLHPELYRAMQFMDQPASNWLFRMLVPATRLLRAGAVLNPEFALRNPARDQFAAFMHKKYKFVPVVDPARALFHLLKGESVGGDDLYNLWQASGGAQSTLVSLNRDYLEADLRKLLGKRTTTDRIKEVIRSPLTALELISQATEEATRLAQFRAGIEAEGATPEGIRRAAYASREIAVDFQRAGSHGRQANQVKAFFNAALQGPDQMARFFRRDPLRYTILALSSITLPSILLYLKNRNDPRYQELPRWRRDMYWAFFDDDSVTFVPKPFELGVIWGTLPERVLEWIAENDPKAFEDFEETLFNSVLPGDPRNVMDWLPDAILPIVEVWANRSAFTNRPIVPRAEQDLRPEGQYGPHTTKTARQIANLFGISPREVEHLAQGYAAGLGRQVLRLLDRLQGEQSLSPVVRPFGGDIFVSAVSLDEFYEELAHLEGLQRTAREMERRGEETSLYDVDEDRLRELRRVRDQLSELRRANRTIMERKDLTIQEKREQTNAITIRMVNLARTAMGRTPVEEPDNMPSIPTSSPSGGGRTPRFRF